MITEVRKKWKKGERFDSPHKTYCQINPSQDNFRLLLISDISRGSRESQSFAIGLGRLFLPKL